MSRVLERPSSVAVRPGGGSYLPAVLTAVTFWSLNFTVVKWGLDEWKPLAYSFDRYAVGTVLFAAWVLVREGSLRVRRADVPLLVVAGAVGIFGNQVAFMYATASTSAATVALLMAVTPALTALAALLLGQERVSARHWVGLLAAAAGAALVLHGSGASLTFASMRGNLLALLMAVTWAMYTVLVAPLMGRYSASRISALVLLVGTPLMLPFAWTQVVGQDYGSLSVGAWGAVTYSLLFSLVLTNILWFGAVHQGGASRASVLLNLQPFLGALFALALLGEAVGGEQWLGGLVIVAGILITQRAGRAAHG